MSRFKALWFRFRAWQLHREADALLAEARHHRRSAKGHILASTEFWMRANDKRRRAIALEALDS